MEGTMKNLLLLFLLFSTVAWAQPRRMGDGPPVRGMMEKLKLTYDQSQQLGKLHSELEKKQIAVRAKIQTLRVDVRDAFGDDKPDRAKIESKINEITKLQGEMKTSHLALWFDVNKILTPEQQKIWKEAPMMMQREGAPGMRRGMHRPMPHEEMMGDNDPEPEDD